MKRFLTLISIENIKMWKRRSTFIMLLIMVAIVILSTSIVRYHEYTSKTNVNVQPTVSADWKTSLQKEVTMLNAQIKQIDSGTNNPRERSLVGSLKMQVAEDQYQINHNIGISSPDSIWTRLTTFEGEAPFSLLIALLLIIVCASAVAGEFSEGTIKMAISRPYFRSEILSAKLIVSLLFGLILLAATLVTNFIMFAVFYGIHGMGANEMLWTGGSVLYIPAILKLLAVYGLDFLQVRGLCHIGLYHFCSRTLTIASYRFFTLFIVDRYPHNGASCNVFQLGQIFAI